MAAVRLNVLSFVLLLLIYGLVSQHHEVLALNGGDEVTVSGPAFIEASTWEGYAQHERQIRGRKAAGGGAAERLQDLRVSLGRAAA